MKFRKQTVEVGDIFCQGTFEYRVDKILSDTHVDVSSVRTGATHISINREAFDRLIKNKVTNWKDKLGNCN